MIVELHLADPLQSEAVNGLAKLIAGALVAGLWQGIVLCAAAGLMLKLVPRTTATIRFVIWAAVFGVSVAMPFVNLPGGAFLGRDGGSGRHVLLDLRWSYVLVGAWLVASAYRLAQLAMQAFGLRALWNGATPVCDEACAKLEVPLIVDRRSVELCTSEDVDRPSVIGFLAPRILIPAWLFDQLTPLELSHIVLHELEHLRRRDDWMNLAQKVGLVLLPLNPSLFWIDRRLSTERELACDDGVLEQTHMPKAYAASLASIAERRMEIRRQGHFGALALAATGLRRRRSELGARIESILGSRAPVHRGFAGGLAAALVVGVVAAGAGLARIPRVVAFGSSAPVERAESVAAIAPREMSLPIGVQSRTERPAQFQNVSFHEPVKPHVTVAKAVIRKQVPTARVRQIARDVALMPKQQPLMVLTSWQGSPVSQVVVQMPDGRVFLAPYAAVPTQAGWLLVQL